MSVKSIYITVTLTLCALTCPMALFVCVLLATLEMEYSVTVYSNMYMYIPTNMLHNYGHSDCDNVIPSHRYL